MASKKIITLANLETFKGKIDAGYGKLGASNAWTKENEFKYIVNVNEDAGGYIRGTYAVPFRQDIELNTDIGLLKLRSETQIGLVRDLAGNLTGETFSSIGLADRDNDGTYAMELSHVGVTNGPTAVSLNIFSNTANETMKVGYFERDNISIIGSGMVFGFISSNRDISCLLWNKDMHTSWKEWLESTSPSGSASPIPTLLNTDAFGVPLGIPQLDSGGKLGSGVLSIATDAQVDALFA